MTRQAMIHRDTPYIDWLRKNPNLDSRQYNFDRGDIDIVWFQYVKGKIMLIEEKMHYSDPTLAQKDTHAIIHQALKYACPRIHFRRYISNRIRTLSYYGLHLVQFQNTGPLDGEIRIDCEPVSLEQLELFHKFEYFPKPQKVFNKSGVNK